VTRATPWLAIGAGAVVLVAIALLGVMVVPRLGNGRGDSAAAATSNDSGQSNDSGAAAETLVGAAALDAPPVVKVPRAAAGADPATVPGNSVALPFEVEPGMSYEVRLGKDEEVYFVLGEPTSDLIVLLDMRGLDQVWTAATYLHRVSPAGELLYPALYANSAPTYAARAMGSFASPRPERHLLRLRNEWSPAEYWLTVYEGRPQKLLPFYGGVTPVPIGLGTAVTGRLAEGDETFYALDLPAGDYTVTFDVAELNGAFEVLGARIELLGALGESRKTLVQYHEAGTTIAAKGEILAAEQGPAILHLKNEDGNVSYTLRVAAGRG
jgi:hypothetical protein